MRKWSLLFIAAAIFSVGAFVYAPFDSDWWLPRNVSVRGPLHIGADVDHLFMICLWITGIAFIGTQIALGYVLWKYAEAPGSTRKATYSHGSQRLEVVWTIIPAAILVFIALYQMGSWSQIKFRSAQPKVKPLAEVTARQFQWLIRYAGPDGKLNTEDDLHMVNDLRFVKETPVVIHLKSKDVLHSFFLPHFRIKQDAVPGLTIPVWFDCDEATKAGQEFDLVCAELCGWGHYKMRGRVTVYNTKAEFDDWMKNALKEQSRDRLGDAQLAASGTAFGGEK